MLQKFNPKNRDLIVNINGQLVHRDKAGVSPFDSARARRRRGLGRVASLQRPGLQIARASRSTRALSRALSIVDLPPPKKIISELKRTLPANKMRDSVHIRLTLTRGVKITSGMDPRLNQNGATLIVLVSTRSGYTKDGLKLITASIRRPPPEVLDARSHHANLLNSILAKMSHEAARTTRSCSTSIGFVAETQNATKRFCRAERRPATSKRGVAGPEGIIAQL